MSRGVVAPRPRKSFSRLKHVLDLPNLIDIQKASFRWFMDEGLRETIDDISPIEDYTGTLAVEFGEYKFGDPPFSQQECREKDLTYQVPLSMTVRFVNKETGEIREQTVFMGDFPMMTDSGTFIINGTERVIVTQLVRSPGAYLMEPKDATKQVFTANLMPSRGSWLELEIDKKGIVYARIDRKRKLPITTLLRALPAQDPNTGFELDTSTNEAILKLFDNSIYIQLTLDKDTTESEEQALVEVFKKQRPGEPPTVENARNLLNSLFFDPKRYDLTKVGRYKLNQRLEVDVPDGTRVLTTQDILSLVRRLVQLPTTLGVPEDSKDYAADAITLSREPLRGELDEYEDFGNRRLRTVGELIQEAFRVGLYRMERVVRERMTTEDVDTITPQTIINIRPVVAALKEFFGSSQLSQFMDQTNSLAGLTHRRRLSALGAGGLTRERAPIEVRDVHPTHYGRMCPIETPEGPNIGLIGSLASFATVSEFGFIQTPYRKVTNGKVTDDIVYLDAAEEAQYTIAQASEPVDEKSGRFLHDQVLCRSKEGEAVMAAPKDIEYMDVAPAQIVSVGTALIPFLEHNDANRALMGANMQRQAVPLMITEPPLVGTGLEYRAAVDTGDVVVAENAGTVVDVDAEKIVVETKDGKDSYDMTKFMRSNQGTLMHQRPIVGLGERVKAEQVLADGSSTSLGELALGKNLLVAFMPFEGYNFEDAIVISERLVKDDVLSSIHIHEYEIDALDQAGRRGDHARHPQPLRGVPQGPRRARGRSHRRRGRLRRPARRQGDAQGRDRADRGGEADPRDLQGEGARGPRHLAEGSARRGRQGHRREDVLARGRRRPAAGRERARPRLRRQEAQDRRGRQARRPPRNKGVIAKIVAEEDMPFLEDGTPVDVVLNPLGVPSRMNIGQILETHLGWAAARGVFSEDEDQNGRRRRSRPPCSTALRRRTSTPRSSSGRSRTRTRRSSSWSTRSSPRVAAAPEGPSLQRQERRAVREQGHRRLHVHPEAAPPRGRQDPRPEHGPVLARHPAAAGRQGAVRRPALRRDGGVGARGLRRRVHAPGDAHDQVRRHRRTGRPTRRSSRARTSPSRRSPSPSRCCSRRCSPRARRGRPLGGGRRGRGARGGGRAAPRRGGAGHRPLAGIVRAAREPGAQESRKRPSASTRTARWHSRPTRCWPRSPTRTWHRTRLPPRRRRTRPGHLQKKSS